jgi:hypothetical protein
MAALDLAPILGSTLRESTMLMFIIGMSLLFSYVMSYLRISQSAAEWIVALHLGKWFLLAMILVLVIVLGFFLPPVSIILMTAPIILPPLKAAGFDLIWFGILMTIVMEMGPHPSAGRAQHLRHQERGAGHSVARRRLGRGPVRAPDGARGSRHLRRARHRDLVSRCGDGTEYSKVNARDPHPRSDERRRRLERASVALDGRLTGKRVETADVVALLEAAIEPGDRVCLEGNNQKQADSSPRRWRRAIPSASTTCTSCSRCWRCPATSSSSSAASRVASIFPSPDRRPTHLARLVQAHKIEIGRDPHRTSNCSAATSWT